MAATAGEEAKGRATPMVVDRGERLVPKGEFDCAKNILLLPVVSPFLNADAEHRASRMPRDRDCAEEQETEEKAEEDAAATLLEVDGDGAKGRPRRRIVNVVVVVATGTITVFARLPADPWLALVDKGVTVFILIDLVRGKKKELENSDFF